MTTRYSPSPPHHCHLLAAHHNSQLPLPSPSLLPPSRNTSLLIKAPPLLLSLPPHGSYRPASQPSLPLSLILAGNSPQLTPPPLSLLIPATLGMLAQAPLISWLLLR
jgi:hypothetical protein